MTKLIMCIIAIYLIIRLMLSKKDKQKLQNFFKHNRTEGNIIDGEIIEDENSAEKGDKS